MRWSCMVILAMAMALSACVPLGVKSGRTCVVWSEGGARIEWRQRLRKSFDVLSPDPGLHTVLRPSHYWLIENGAEQHLRHVEEHATYDRKTRRRDRDYGYPPKVCGDADIGRWVLIATNVRSREREDYFLTLFDRERVIAELTLLNCDRWPHGGRTTVEIRRIAQSPFIFGGLVYNAASKSIRFVDEAGPGAVDLLSGEIRRDVD